MILGSHIKRPKQYNLQSVGLKGQALVTGRWLIVVFIRKINYARSRSLSPRYGLEGSGSQPFFLAIFSGLLTSPIILTFTPPANVHVQVRLSRIDTCPISPYPKWLGVVVKAEEHGPVRCRVFNGSNDSFPFVLCRHTVQGSFFYQRRYFRFFPKLFLYRPYPFFQVGLGDTEDKVILSYVSRLLGILLYVLGYIPHRLGPWIPM